MRIKSTLASLAAIVVVPAIVLSSAPTHAAVPSSIEGGDIYRVKNLTKGQAEFSDPASADACDVLQYKVRIHNGGPDAVLNNVTVQAAFPTAASTQNISLMILRADNASPSSTSDTATVNISSAQKLSYVTNSTELLDANGNLIKTYNDSTDGVVTEGGINIGAVGISINEKRYVQFKEKINCPTPVTPAYTCDAFTITTDKDRKVKISNFSTSATNGAVFKNAVVDWGDNSTALNAANIIGQSHQYGKDGTYLISATAHFTVNGQDVTAGGPKCQQQVTFSPNTPPKVTPPPTTPTTPPANLVNTGPGSVAAIFAATTAFGAVAHRRFLSRRLSRQS
jgi:hypothetical protein